MPLERMTWAALTRDEETLTVPYTAWSGILRRAAGRWKEDPVMDVIAGVWRVPPNSVSSFLGVLLETPSSEFERIAGRIDVSPGVSTDVTRRLLSPEAAEEAKAHLIAFLERGAFMWCVVRF